MMNQETIIKAIALLKASYPSALNNISKEDLKTMIKVWYEDFKDVPKQDFLETINTVRYTSKFFPSIAEIKEKLAKRKLEDVPSAEEEWLEVKKAISKYGYYREIEAMKSLNPYTAKIVSYIGFQRICMANSEEQTWNRKEFIDEYNALKEKNILDIQTGRLEYLNNLKLESKKED